MRVLGTRLCSASGKLLAKEMIVLLLGVRLNDYPYAVPFVIDDEGNWFLKTAYPDRKLKGRV